MICHVICRTRTCRICFFSCFSMKYVESLHRENLSQFLLLWFTVKKVTLFFINIWFFCTFPKHCLATKRKTPEKNVLSLFTRVSSYGVICVFSKYFKQNINYRSTVAYLFDCSTTNSQNLKSRVCLWVVFEYLNKLLMLGLDLNLLHENSLLFNLLFAPSNLFNLWPFMYPKQIV